MSEQQKDSQQKVNPIYADAEAMKAIRYLVYNYPIEVVLDWFKSALKLEKLEP